MNDLHRPLVVGAETRYPIQLLEPRHSYFSHREADRLVGSTHGSAWQKWFSSLVLHADIQ